MFAKVERKILEFFHKKRTIRRANYMNRFLISFMVTTTYLTLAKKA